jgi:hypothetical protein
MSMRWMRRVCVRGGAARKAFDGLVKSLALLTVTASHAGAQDESLPPSSTPRQSLQDAWWTGPMLAPNASTLPHGHFLIEPYLFDVIRYGRYDHQGDRQSAPRSHDFGSLTYVLYGLSDKLTVGAIPVAGYNTVSGGPSSSGGGLGDVTLNAQYRLTLFQEGRSTPTTSLVVQETLPTGNYQRLDRPSDAFGSGAYTTTVSLYSQTYFWLGNGRILRTRLDISGGFSSSVNIEDASAYGTEAGFRGHAKPGNSFFVDSSWEYSVTRSWVLAIDFTYRHDANTRLTGYYVQDPTSPAIALDTDSSEAFGLAPAVEYSWKSNLGVLVGVRVIPAGRNTAATITPAVAINMVY